MGCCRPVVVNIGGDGESPGAPAQFVYANEFAANGQTDPQDTYTVDIAFPAGTFGVPPVVTATLAMGGTTLSLLGLHNITETGATATIKDIRTSGPLQQSLSANLQVIATEPNT